MSKQFARAFYDSDAWKDTREAYKKSVNYLCERCLKQGIYKPGSIVHHKIHLTPANINDPNITLSFDNLELLCREHHGEEHAKDLEQGRAKLKAERQHKKYFGRYEIDENGHVKGC